jgi:Skp family chaperone for outer membrane proteins
MTTLAKRLPAAFLAAVLFLAAPLAAQEATTPAGAGGIVVLNQERLISQTLYGQRIQSELEAASTALSTENRRIESQLSDEELRLTELRDTLPTNEFRALADEFDTRVEGIRTAQAAKTRDLQTQAEAAQTRFFEESFPILLEIVRERGAAVLMDSRAVLLSAESVDITEIAVARIDAELGEGGEAPLIVLGGSDPVDTAPAEALPEDAPETPVPPLDLDIAPADPPPDTDAGDGG